jgi:hypothetical protein
MANLTLTNQSGHTVNVFSTPLSAEFMHLNGDVAPLLTATVPQDVYVSAAISITGATFTCVTLDASGGLELNEYAGDISNPVVNVAGPVTLSGASSSLVLSLQASQSAIFSSCNSLNTAQGVPATTGLTPTFTLGSTVPASLPTNSNNGAAMNLAGIITSVDTAASQFGVSSQDGLAWTLSANGTTVFQGVANLSALAVGMPVILDMSVKQDGSLAATRVAVPDANTASLSTFQGPVAQVDGSSSMILLGPLMAQGQIRSVVVSTTSTTTISGLYFDVSSSIYQTSSRFTNLSSLPFTASFNATNIVPGQSVLISNHQLNFTASNRDPATTITLVPQTIDGTVVGTSSAGGFTVYTVALASYDLFPNLAVQAGQTVALQNPATIFVYADANTQMLNSAPAAAGSVLRFNGLVFDDNGTLRMDCSEVSDGVPL